MSFDFYSAKTLASISLDLLILSSELSPKNVQAHTFRVDSKKGAKIGNLGTAS